MSSRPVAAASAQDRRPIARQRPPAAPLRPRISPRRSTVWDQMNQWLQNVELAFPAEVLPLKQWLPILDAGLSSLNVGLIPPALDQVLIGTVDRSRTMDARLVISLGLNEGVFPAPPKSEVLLTESDRAVLEQSGVVLGSNARQQVSRERFACLATKPLPARLQVRLSRLEPKAVSRQSSSENPAQLQHSL